MIYVCLQGPPTAGPTGMPPGGMGGMGGMPGMPGMGGMGGGMGGMPPAAMFGSGMPPGAQGVPGTGGQPQSPPGAREANRHRESEEPCGKAGSHRTGDRFRLEAKMRKKHSTGTTYMRCSSATVDLHLLFCACRLFYPLLPSLCLHSGAAAGGGMRSVTIDLSGGLEGQVRSTVAQIPSAEQSLSSHTAPYVGLLHARFACSVQSKAHPFTLLLMCVTTICQACHSGWLKLQDSGTLQLLNTSQQ